MIARLRIQKLSLSHLHLSIRTYVAPTSSLPPSLPSPVPLITQQDLETHINALRGNGWYFRQSNRNIEQKDMWELRHSGRFPSFKAAMGYVNDVANLAKSEKHHPTIVIFDRVNVAIALITHDTAKPPIIDAPSTDLHAPATHHPGITLRDIRMALLINPLLDLHKVIDRSPPTEDPIPRYEDLMGVNIEKSN